MTADGVGGEVNPDLGGLSGGSTSMRETAASSSSEGDGRNGGGVISISSVGGKVESGHGLLEGGGVARRAVLEAEAEEVIRNFSHDDLSVDSVKVFDGHDSLGGDSGTTVDGGGLRSGSGHESVIADVDDESTRNEGIVVDNRISSGKFVRGLPEYGYC